MASPCCGARAGGYLRRELGKYSAEMGGAFAARVETGEEMEIREQSCLFILRRLIWKFGHGRMEEKPCCAAEFCSIHGQLGSRRCIVTSPFTSQSGLDRRTLLSHSQFYLRSPLPLAHRRQPGPCVSAPREKTRWTKNLSRKAGSRMQLCRGRQG